MSKKIEKNLKNKSNILFDHNHQTASVVGLESGPKLRHCKSHDHNFRRRKKIELSCNTACARIYWR